jgi:Tfp pilus assembly protein PilN
MEEAGAEGAETPGNHRESASKNDAMDDVVTKNTPETAQDGTAGPETTPDDALPTPPRDVAGELLDALPDYPAEIHYLPAGEAEAEDAPPPAPPAWAPSLAAIAPNGTAPKGVKGVALKFARTVGIDITPRYVRVASFGERGGKIANIAFAQQVNPDYLTWEDLAEHKAELAQSVKAALKQAGIRQRHAAFALPLSAAALKTAVLPNMTGEALKDMIAADPDFWRRALDADMDPADYHIAYDVLSRNGADETMRLLVCGYRHDVMAFFKDVLAEAGLTPVAADFRETALLRFVREIAGDTPDAPLALLQIGPEENHILLFKDGAPHHKEITINDWDRVALMNGDDQLMASLVGRYTDEIRTASATFQSQYGTTPVDKILISSYVPLAPAFIKAIVSSLGDMRCYALQREGKGGTSWRAQPLSGAEEEVYKEALTQDAVAVSLAGRYPTQEKTGLYRNLADHNLLPDAEALGKAVAMRYTALLAVLAFAALCAAALVLGTMATEQRKFSLAGKLEDLKRRSSAYEQRLEEAKQLSLFTAQLKEAEELPAKLPLNQGTLADTLSYVDRSIPDGVWLEQFDYEFPFTVSLSGNAFADDEILAFMNKLSAGGLFEHVSLKMMEANEEKETGGTADGEAIGRRLVKSFRIDGTYPGAAAAKAAEEAEKAAKSKKKAPKAAAKEEGK